MVFLVINSKGLFGFGDFIIKLTNPPNCVPYCKEAAPLTICISFKASWSKAFVIYSLISFVFSEIPESLDFPS